MPALQNNGGDFLARGGHRFTFKPMGEKKTDEQWAAMFQEEKAPEIKVLYIFKCPVHGDYVSDREAYLSGGYPLVNEYAKGKCPKDDCGEKSEYAGYQKIGGDASAQAGTDGSVAGEAVASE